MIHVQHVPDCHGGGDCECQHRPVDRPMLSPRRFTWGPQHQLTARVGKPPGRLELCACCSEAWPTARLKPCTECNQGDLCPDCRPHDAHAEIDEPDTSQWAYR